jgi:hypothetical protein
MSRRSILLASGVLLLLVVCVATAAVALIRHEPAFYVRAARSPGTARKQLSNEFYAQCCTLKYNMDETREWAGQFTDDQVNSYLQEGFRTSRVEEVTLPDGISDPRVVFEADRLRLGFRYGRGLWSTVVSIDLRVWVAKGEPNVIGLELQGMHAGSLPISSQSLLDYVFEVARRQNVDVTWYRYEGNPVAILRFQNRRSRTTVQLQQLELHPGKLMIQGRSVDPTPSHSPTSTSD